MPLNRVRDSNEKPTDKCSDSGTCRGLVMNSPTATKKKGYLSKVDSPFSLWVTRPKYYFYTLIETTYPSKPRTLKTVPSSKMRYCPLIPVSFPVK